MSNLSFEAHCAFNDSNIIDEFKIITTKNGLGEKVILKTQPLAWTNLVKLVNLKVNF